MANPYGRKSIRDAHKESSFSDERAAMMDKDTYSTHGSSYFIDFGKPRLTITTALENLTTEDAIHDTANMSEAKRERPWDKKRKRNGPNELRRSLPKVNYYDKEVEYTALAPYKVTMRLERVTGTDQVKIRNYRYLKNLSSQIAEEEERVTLVKRRARKEQENESFRNMILAGLIEPPQDRQDLLNHPVYRANKIMKDLREIHYPSGSTLRSIPHITPVEPFAEYAKTGLLFAHHKNHYKKVEPLERFKQAPPPRTPSGTSNTSRNSESRKPSLKVKKEEEEDESNDEEAELECSHTELTGLDLRNLLQRNSMTLAAKRCLLTDADFEVQEKSKPQRMRIVEEMFGKKYKVSDQMFEHGGEVSRTLKRAQLKADDFCNRVHRKLFAS